MWVDLLDPLWFLRILMIFVEFWHLGGVEWRLWVLFGVCRMEGYSLSGVLERF